MKALIFGANGQDGYYLTEHLNSHRIDVTGVSRSGNKWINGDVGDFKFVSGVIHQHQPDFIFHLAANSTTHHLALFDNTNAISVGTINILESVRLYTPDAKVFLPGSAVQFKNEGTPIDEATPFEATSAYSVARIHSVYTGRYFRDRYHLNVYVGYLFNHDSPLRTERHVNQKIVQSVLRINNGSSEKLSLGNIDVRKEFNYAGDVVEAMWTLINQNEIFEAVIGSGKAYSIKEWMEHCFKRINKDWKEYVDLQKDYKSEYEILVSNPQKIMSLGWKPKHTFDQLIDLMFGQRPIS